MTSARGGRPLPGRELSSASYGCSASSRVPAPPTAWAIWPVLKQEPQRGPARFCPNLTSPLSPGRITAEDVFAAAARDDPAATRIVDRLARIAEVLVSLLDINRVIAAGSIANSAAQVIYQARRTRAERFYQPIPGLEASQLGNDIIILGGIERAIQIVQADPLSISLFPPQ